MLSTRKPVGDSIGRVEGKDKVTGRAKYTADHAIPNLAYAILVQSEIPHGRVSSDSLEKRSAEGRCRSRRPPCSDASELSRLAGSPSRSDFFDLPLERRPPLSDLTVQHIWQHMAFVVADSPENATFAASLWDVEYEISAWFRMKGLAARWLAVGWNSASATAKQEEIMRTRLYSYRKGHRANKLPRNLRTLVHRVLAGRGD
jgi:hypothetical protein